MDPLVKARLRAAAGLACLTWEEDPFLSAEGLSHGIPRVDWPGDGLLRCIFGEPLLPAVVMASAWRTRTVADLALGIYEERAFERMPILGDALEEAGCDHADILDHCRVGQPHARGCWVVDLLLGKL